MMANDGQWWLMMVYSNLCYDFLGLFSFWDAFRFVTDWLQMAAGQSKSKGANERDAGRRQCTLKEKALWGQGAFGLQKQVHLTG